MGYWGTTQSSRVKRIIFDNTLSHKEAVELVKTSEGRVDVVTKLSPLETLRMAQSPFGRVVKNRGSLESVFGLFNMRKPESPWLDVQLRQAVNYAINRADLIRYATKGNGVIIPALISQQGFGYDPDLAPYPFDPAQAKQLLREAGYPEGLSLLLIAPEALEVQATVISKMLEQVGFAVKREMLDPVAYSQQTILTRLKQPPERQTWDIALMTTLDVTNFAVYNVYHLNALDGWSDWVIEQPKLHQLYKEVLGTVDQEKQRALIHQMERHTRDQAYFVFLYNPIGLYAVNKAVKFVPYVSRLSLADTSVTDQHWSVRKQKAAVQE